MAKLKILIFGEGISLAHIGRPLILAKFLQKQDYSITFACDLAYSKFVTEKTTLNYKSIKSISSKEFMRSLYLGKKIYDSNTLSNYIKDDLELIKSTKPDLVIGDFRISLAISAKIMGLPYLALSNAHWSPQAIINYEAPDTFYTKLFGTTINNIFFKTFYSTIFKQQAQAFNKIAKSWGYSPVEDIREMYTQADHTIFLDPLNWIEMNHLPENNFFSGPIIYSPEFKFNIPNKYFLSKINNIYVTLGSSGNINTLPEIIHAIQKNECNAFVATAGRINIKSTEKIYCADFLPGEEILEKSNICICNGGSATVYQALSKGVPVIGIPQNLDQFLTMQIVERKGLGLIIRPENVNRRNISLAIHQISENKNYLFQARKNRQSFQTSDSLIKIKKYIENNIQKTEIFKLQKTS